MSFSYSFINDNKIVHLKINIHEGEFNSNQTKDSADNNYLKRS